MQQSAAQSEEDANEESRSGGRRLVWKARDGTTCVAVFANHGEKSIFRTIKIEHTSKDQASGEYKSSNSFPVSEGCKTYRPDGCRLLQGARARPEQRPVSRLTFRLFRYGLTALLRLHRSCFSPL
jgi:hypothetical protein